MLKSKPNMYTSYQFELQYRYNNRSFYCNLPTPQEIFICQLYVYSRMVEKGGHFPFSVFKEHFSHPIFLNNFAHTFFGCFLHL